MAFKEEKQIAEIIKKALLIVDELSHYDFDDVDDQEKLENLIQEAKKLTKHRLWNLK